MSTDRDTFGTFELATCLSHFDLGTITELTEFPRGSRRAPKLVIDCEQGRFLFKRRARGRDDLAKVAFTHQIQLALAGQNFPLPHLLGTRRENNSMLVLEDHIYEMFEYIEGGNYDGSLESTYHSGHILGLYHKLLAGFQGAYSPPTGSYHNAKAIHQAIGNTVRSLPVDEEMSSSTLSDAVESLSQAYTHCAKEANELGLAEWPKQIVHGDWHPGNMLFREQKVVAVIDYDAARLQQRVIDLANGALQFSIIGGGEDPSTWPEHIDERRFREFIRGYDTVNIVSVAELKSVPFLMCEAMIAEAVLPIAATGSFGRMAGFPFLLMIDRKVKWLLDSLERIYKVMEQ
ncbi:MAG: phosphotransferase enzyme family protein [Planctomycetota bacterium]